MKPQDVKYHRCPRCARQATVIVQFENSSAFERDEQGNIQYHCTHCGTTFAIDQQGMVIIQLTP
jgi:transcription elongation factor Elf1